MMRAALVLGVLVLAGACTNDAGPAMPVDPAVIYTQMCARCHGVDGHGDAAIKATMPNLRDFSDPAVRNVPNEQVEQVIMGGRNQMPAFGSMLSLPKLQSLTGYVKRLGVR
jgi:mono/diheme cytochrome c family protein